MSKIKGPIFTLSLTKPLNSFFVSVDRGYQFNGSQAVKGNVETWEVLAETPEKAIIVAEWHFFKAKNIKLVENI